MRNILFTLLVLFVIGFLQMHAQTPQNVTAVDKAAEASNLFLQSNKNSANWWQLGFQWLKCIRRPRNIIC